MRWAAMRPQQAVVDGEQHPHGGAAVAVEQRDELFAGDEVLLGADGQGGEHGALALGHGAAGSELVEFCGRLAEFVEQVEGR